MRYYPAYIVTAGAHIFVGNYDSAADAYQDYPRAFYTCIVVGKEIHIDLVHH